MQALGDTFTVMTEYGTMVRIAGNDAEAIGETVKAGSAAITGSTIAADSPGTAGAALTAKGVKERAWAALRGVYDPEIPVNVVELGLVYANDVASLPEGGYRVDIKMTLTAPGCGMGNVLKDDAERRISAIPDVKAVHVEIVVEPPWNITMMSEAARLELGL
jgi:probable FeS assembly SUF system protein SufT